MIIARIARTTGARVEPDGLAVLGVWKLWFVFATLLFQQAGVRHRKVILPSSSRGIYPVLDGKDASWNKAECLVVGDEDCFFGYGVCRDQHIERAERNAGRRAGGSQIAVVPPE